MKFMLNLFFNLLIAVAVMAQSDSYQFQHEVKAEMKHMEGDQADGAFDYSFLFPEKGGYIGLIGDMTQGGQTIKTKAIFDIKNENFVALVDQGGMKIGMKMSTAENLPDDMQERINSVKINKTGNSQKILGYTCEEYEAFDDESYTLIWVTNEITLPNFYDALSTMNRQENTLGQNMPRGFMMLMKAWPNGKGTEEKVEMLVTEIKLNQPTTISTAGYQIMEMPNR